MRTHLACIVAIAVVVGSARASDKSPDVTTPPPAAQFLIVPLRVHVLTGDAPEVGLQATKLVAASAAGHPE